MLHLCHKLPLGPIKMGIRAPSVVHKKLDRLSTSIEDGRMSANRTKKRAKSSTPATIIHATHVDGEKHIVGIGDLRVVIVPDGDVWFAQGLEIDFAVQGSTVDDARKQFEDGLCATVDEHLKVFGNIKNLLRPAPPSVWSESFAEELCIKNRYTQVTTHCIKQQFLPFEGIQYLQLAKAA